MKSKVNEQLVIKYGGPTKRATYTTAYTEEQAEEAVRRCVARYGTTANVVAELAPEVK